MKRYCHAGTAALIVAALQCPVIAFANDSVGHLAAGGIELGRSDDIELRSEDLFVSLEQVRVRYVFRNTSAKDIDTLVAFPVPDLPPPSDTNSVTVPHPDKDDFLNFKTSVDGAAVAMSVDRRAEALGIDRTAKLSQLKVPLSPYDSGAASALDGLSQQTRAELAALGIVREQMMSMSASEPMTAHLFPNWTMKSTYYWQQTFPSGQDIVIEHSYSPSIGASVGTMLGDAALDPAALENYRKRYCVDDEFLAAAARAQQRAKERDGGGIMERRLEYVLVTGANWRGPIKDFRVEVDKGRESRLVSFCGSGVRKVSPTSFEMRAKDFWPDRNLEILILAPLDE